VSDPNVIAETLEHFTKLPKHTYTRPEEADVTSLLNSICNFDFVVTIVIVQMCLVLRLPKVVFGHSASTLSLIICLPHILRFLTSMSSGSHILALLSKHWWLNCSTFALN
jgi:hypothetical protein